MYESVSYYAIVTGLNVKSVEDSSGFFGSTWRFLREVLGDLYEGLAYLSAVGRSSTSCCMIVQRLLHDHLPIGG